jgi:diguanylate cyclase (GGDEF)-like protein
MAKGNARVSDREGADAGIQSQVVAVERAWKQVGSHGRADQLAAMHAAVRTLVERAEAQGFSKLADLASMIEVMLSPVVTGGDAISNEFNEIIRDYLKALQRLSRELPAPPPVVRAPLEAAADARSLPRVYLLEPDQALAEELALQVQDFGYRVDVMRDLPELMAAIESGRPYALVIDLPEADGQARLAASVANLRQQAGARLPIIVIAKQGDVDSRLRAARAGADAYLVKPFDLHELIDQLDRLGTCATREPFHIVIVEDSSTQATYYSAILNKAGMVTTVVNDPMRVLAVMDENAADLVLMDMYMPGCNGTELAKVIRQVPRYASIPIVYLSAETEIDRQLDALSLGGDDFLTKPINPAHLIRSVAIRAERARSLRTLMLTDTLTGLLNHTRIKEQLHNEVARAARGGGTVSFAMLDIDHFKSVNDTHGHHVGDRVIKTLARVLQQRLRQTDYIGRYGGEEFAVILPDADLEKATAILDEVRRGFSKIHQLSPKGVFAVSFSGGVACFPRCEDAIKLALNADKALYAAKRGGRDRIVPYAPDSGF